MHEHLFKMCPVKGCPTYIPLNAYACYYHAQGYQTADEKQREIIVPSNQRVAEHGLMLNPKKLRA